MNIFAHTIIVMSYALGMSIFLAGESVGLKQTSINIEKCSFEQVNQTEFKHSSYIEQITHDPLILHASEPIRLSIQANMTVKESNTLSGTWITIHLLHDASFCITPDHKKTQYMQQKSEYVQEQLQERMNERNP